MDTATANSSTPAYTTTSDKNTDAFYVSTIGPDRTGIAVSRELIVNCAGDTPTDKALVVLDQVEDGGIIGIEVLNPVHVETAEKDGRFTVELTVGTTDENLVTVEDAIGFDHASWDSYPGVEVDYTVDGRMVAIRLAETDMVEIGL
ncbi:MAG TPA: hypothetical protein PLV77_10800 [Solirubrobacterales bacterium]|nr:hypothetical protein [Solirubrobacterales bacterium]